MNKPKNEATFEAHLGASLKALFPGSNVTVTHQVQFSLRLGHNEKKIDGKKDWASKGRLDVLLSSAVRHVAVLELKREDLDLTNDDRDQGLSYARLLQPMPPLVVVSNGGTTRFYTTVDGKEWTPQGFTEEVFAKLIASGAARAADQRDEAIRSLLASDPSAWADYVRSFTKLAIEKRGGELRDFSAPFARGFSIERLASLRVLGRLRKNAEIIALVGPPLSGKSNVLMQCCEKMAVGQLVPLYIDASSTQQGPLRLLASVFVKNLFGAATLDQVRQWLSTSLRTMPAGSRLVLFLDDVMPDLAESWLSDLDELLAFAQSSPLSVVMALDPNTHQALSTRPGRGTKTEFGRRAEVIQLDLLSDKEFNSAMELLFERTRSTPYFGGQFNLEYREPRLLRVIAASTERVDHGDAGVMLKFPSTTTVSEVDLAWRAFVRNDHELVDDLRWLARAYLQDLGTRSSDAELQLASYRAAAIRKDVATKLLPPAVLERLMVRSFLSTRLGPNEEILLLPRHLELFARAAALELGVLVCGAGTLDESYKILMERSDLFPLGDIVGAAALREVAKQKGVLFSRIVDRALNDPPHCDIVPAGSVVEVSLFGRPVTTFELPEPVPTTGNLHPWLVLAQVAMFPLGGGPSEEASPNAWIIANVGSFAGFLRRVGDDRRRTVEGFHFHEVQGRGSVPCLNNGVVEPIGQAIIAGFHSRPDEMRSMAEYAIQEGRFHLVWRLNTGAREVTSATDPSVAGAAEEVVALTDEYIRQDFATLLHEDDQATKPSDSQPHNA